MSTFTYNIDHAHSTVRFWVRHMMIAKVHGELSDIDGSVTMDPSNPESAQIEATIQTASLTTGNGDRDGHLKSADFLDVAENPTISFKSTAVRSVGGTDYEVDGELTIKNVTKQVTLKAELTPEVKNPFGGFKIGASATLAVNREDFNITWNQALEAGGVLVGKEINLQIDVELDRPE